MIKIVGQVSSASEVIEFEAITRNFVVTMRVKTLAQTLQE